VPWSRHPPRPELVVRASTGAGLTELHGSGSVRGPKGRSHRGRAGIRGVSPAPCGGSWSTRTPRSATSRANSGRTRSTTGSPRGS